MRVLMCCSDIDTYKGGMVSVVKNYLSWEKWGDDIRIRFIPTHIEGSKGKKSLYFLNAYRKIWMLLRKGEIDIAHLHMAERGSFYRKALILRLCRRFGVPVILHHHAAEFEFFYESLSKRQKAFVKDTFSAAAVNLVLGEYWNRRLLGRLSPGNTRILYNAVNVPDTFPDRSGCTELLFLGRLGQRKGTYELLEALSRIDGELPGEVRCRFCGDGEVRQVKERIRELGLEKRIASVGWIDGEKKKRVMARAAVHILPSWNEGLPMSILETMAEGIPSIATDIAAVPEAVKNGENGLLIHPGDVDGLAEGIRQMVFWPERRLEFGRKSYETVKERFSMERHMAELAAIYRETAQKRC